MGLWGAGVGISAGLRFAMEQFIVLRTSQMLNVPELHTCMTYDAHKTRDWKSSNAVRLHLHAHVRAHTHTHPRNNNGAAWLPNQKRLGRSWEGNHQGAVHVLSSN